MTDSLNLTGTELACPEALDSAFQAICREYRAAKEKALGQLDELLALCRKYPDGATVYVIDGHQKTLECTVLSADFYEPAGREWFLNHGTEAKITYFLERHPNRGRQTYFEHQVFLTPEQALSRVPVVGNVKKIPDGYHYQITWKDGRLLEQRREKNKYTHAVVVEETKEAQFCKNGWSAQKKQAAAQKKGRAAFIVELLGDV